MTDARLREAERRWRESGSVDDEARLLLERVRAGELTAERLELAAFAGHAAARRAVGDDGLARLAELQRAAGEAIDEREPLLALCAGLRRWGREPLVRAGLAALETLEQRARHELDARDRDTRALRSWLDTGVATRAHEVGGPAAGSVGELVLILVDPAAGDSAAALALVGLVRSAAAHTGGLRLRRAIAAQVGGRALR